MTNTNINAVQLSPIGGTTNSGYKIGYIDGGTKAAQNDTWTVTQATTVIWACITTDADGVADPVTISTNVLTLTSATATAGSGFIIYKP